MPHHALLIHHGQIQQQLGVVFRLLEQGREDSRQDEVRAMLLMVTFLLLRVLYATGFCSSGTGTPKAWAAFSCRFA